jgi:Fic family protein
MADMTIREQLVLLHTISGLNQEQLSARLRVTVTAYNRWYNEKSVPRAGAQMRIQGLLSEYTGVKDTQGVASVSEYKEAYIATAKKDHRTPLRTILREPDLRDQFALSLTFHTNSIEGSTFSEADTSVVLFDNATLPNKTLIEHLEARNHQTALLYVFDYIAEGGGMTETLILKLHSILMNGIRPDAGVYRTHAVRIVGTHVPTTNHLRIPKKMSECVKMMQKTGGNVYARLAETHAFFEQIHPFSDGNGRIGRLLLCAQALRDDLPPPVVRREKRAVYMKSLNRAQLHQEHVPLQEFLLDCIVEGYAILNRRGL